MFFIIRSKFFDLYCNFAGYNKRILYALTNILSTLKVSLKLILCAKFLIQCTCSLLSIEYATCFKLDEGEKITKQKTHNQFGFYSTGKC